MALNINVRAAYLVRHDAAETVRRLLDLGGLVVTEDLSVDPAQLPRYLVSDGKPVQAAAPDLLSSRERQVLVLVAAGMDNTEIGQAMHLATNTVKTHARKLFRKLGARSRAHAVHIAHQRGILGGA